MKLYILLLLFAVDIIAVQEPSDTTEATTTDKLTNVSTPTTPTTTKEVNTTSTAITPTTAAETTSTPTTEAETASSSTTETETVSTPTTETVSSSTTETVSTPTTETETASAPTTEAETASTTTTEAETASITTTEAETASTSTTAGKSTPTAATTTQEPSIKQNFACQDGNTTKFSLTGSFALSITYNKTNAGLTTVPIEVPQTKQSNGTCGNSSTESLTFDFFNGWSITYIFQEVVSSENQLLSAPDKYYISNITVVYVHDEHLPNSITADAKVESKFSQAGYLEATSDGYYTCQANIALKMNDDLTLTTTDFKYKAFNDKGDINLDSGTVTECPSDESSSSSSIVAIAAGAAVAGLVIIVVIAYLIWRKRSRKRRYEHALMWAGTSDNLDDS